MRKHLIEFVLALVFVLLLLAAVKAFGIEFITICTLATIASKVMLIEVKEIQEKNKKKD